MTTKMKRKYHNSEAKDALLAILDAADRPMSTQTLALLALNYRHPESVIHAEDITVSMVCNTGRTLRLLRDYGRVIGSRKNCRAYWQINRAAEGDEYEQ